MRARTSFWAALAATLLLVWASTALAQEDFTKTPTAGTFDLGCQLAAATPDALASASAGFADAATGELLACGDGGPGEIVRATFTVPADTLPRDVVCYAFAQLGCAGERSEPSPNTATLKLASPPAPVGVVE